MIGFGFAIPKIAISGRSFGITLSGLQDVQGAATGTAIGTISGGTGPYTVTDATNQTQIASGNLLQVGAVSPPIGTASITLHDTGTPAAPDAVFTISTVPQVVTVDLVAASDSGASSTDNITNVTTPDIDLIFGSVPLAADVVEIKDGATTIVTHTITSGEIVGSDVTLGLSALSDGVHALAARHLRGSLVGAWGSALSVTIDTVAPTLSSASGAQDGTIATQADLSFSTNEGNGSYVWIISTSATPPSPTQIKAGNDSTGVASYKASPAPVAVSAIGAQSVNVSGMTNGTYHAYFLQTDVAGNDSLVAASAPWTQSTGFTPTYYILGF